MQLTDEQIAAIVEDARAKIRADALEQATSYLASSVKSALQSTLWDEVSEIVKAEVVPEVKLLVHEHRDALIHAAIATSEDLAQAMRQAMLAALTKKLSTDYGAREVFKVIFGY